MVANMIVRNRVRRGSTVPLLDAAVKVLVLDPSASLAEIAAAAGIGRTTLHKHYATRDDLLRAVGHRAIDLCEQAAESAERSDADDGGLRALAEAMVPIGSHPAVLWRNPRLGRSPGILRRGGGGAPAGPGGRQGAPAPRRGRA